MAAAMAATAAGRPRSIRRTTRPTTTIPATNSSARYWSTQLVPAGSYTAWRGHAMFTIIAAP
jgi:hypothetical protein